MVFKKIYNTFNIIKGKMMKKSFKDFIKDLMEGVINFRTVNINDYDEVSKIFIEETMKNNKNENILSENEKERKEILKEKINKSYKKLNQTKGKSNVK